VSVSRRPWFRVAILFLTLSAVAGCHAAGGETRRVPVAGKPAAAREARPGVEVPPEGEARPGVEVPPEGDAAATARQQEAVLPPVDPDPARLLNHGEARVADLLGTPDLIREEASAAIWQYRGRACVLDVFFYPAEGALKVRHLEARDATAAPLPTRRCLKALLRRQQIRQAG